MKASIMWNVNVTLRQGVSQIFGNNNVSNIRSQAEYKSGILPVAADVWREREMCHETENYWIHSIVVYGVPDILPDIIRVVYAEIKYV